MNAFVVKYKGYIIHAAAVGVVFISPSIQELIKANPAYTAVATMAWGFLLHWASGK
jgi:hypothetical protein